MSQHSLAQNLRNWLNWRTFVQLVFLAMVIAIAVVLWRNAGNNLRRSGLAISFDFLKNPASFDIAETPISFQPSDSYSRALLVGLLNSLKVMVTGIVGATVVGVTAGIARLSHNWLLRQVAAVYVEIFRNTPVYLQLAFWYALMTFTLPATENPWQWGLVSLSKSGIAIPWLKTTLSPEFSALVLGLTLFTAAFIAEIVRGGILAVPKGQWEAAKALGLKPLSIMRLVILPQALRTILPPLTSQYLNLAKNSSLAIVTGYRDIYAIASTTINQTGRPINVVLLLAITYLCISLIISLVMNAFNAKVRIVER